MQKRADTGRAAIPRRLLSTGEEAGKRARFVGLGSSFRVASPGAYPPVTSIIALIDCTPVQEAPWVLFMFNFENYRAEWVRNVRGDLLSGLVVALALVPEAIAFSIIAGVDPKVGLYASVVIAIVISIFGGRPATRARGRGEVF